MRAEDPRVILVANDTLKVHPVPVILWGNGYVAFIQRTPWQLGVVPFVIHTTFQRFGREGKRGRLRCAQGAAWGGSGTRWQRLMAGALPPPLPARPCREFGLWQMDPPEYYAGHFLTYRNNVREVVEQVKHERYNGSMPFFLQNWVGAAYQLATLRCGGERRACRVHTAMTARAP